MNLKPIQQQEIKSIDFRDNAIRQGLFSRVLKRGEEQFQYSIEYRNGVLQIVELNFKPNTKTTMALPIPVYNEFVIELNKRITRDGLKANDMMPLFIGVYEKYRRIYLGATQRLKPSSYSRYASVLYLLWHATDGVLGFRAKLVGQRTIKTLTQDTNKIVIDTEVIGKGYYIFPAEHSALLFVDNEQKGLDGWVK